MTSSIVLENKKIPSFAEGPTQKFVVATSEDEKKIFLRQLSWVLHGAIKMSW